MSRDEAIGLLTTGSAFSEFTESDRGRMPGMLADIVALSQDITTVPQAALAKTRNVLTIMGGEIAFDNLKK